jgi:hypothetical protein
MLDPYPVLSKVKKNNLPSKNCGYSSIIWWVINNISLLFYYLCTTVLYCTVLYCVCVLAAAQPGEAMNESAGRFSL